MGGQLGRGLGSDAVSTVKEFPNLPRTLMLGRRILSANI